MIEIDVFSAAVNGFLEDKDYAAAQRSTVIEPALTGTESIRLDFSGVRDASQSFIHALIAVPLRTHGINALKRIEFKGASDPVRDAITMVVNYTIAGAIEESNVSPD